LIALRITGVVLDMDGLLIDTEPVWRTAQKEVFAELGVELSEADLLEGTGVRVDEMAAAFLPVPPPVPPGAPVPPPVPPGAPVPPPVPPGAPVPPAPDPAEVAGRITDLVVDYVRRDGVPMPGVPEAIALFRRAGLRLAIASSSPLRLIDAVCDRLGLDIDIRCSALDEPHGKPAPDVYLAAARRLALRPDRCLAVEDAPAGVVSAKAAGMSCLAVPDPLLAGDPRYRRADLVLPSLTDLDEPTLRRLCWLASGRS
jgi:mannitol-1-/sugar-/sorbitol-6-/2-deoxyglucose-6-phosphatase